jgi:Na+/proline symporter
MSDWLVYTLTGICGAVFLYILIGGIQGLRAWMRMRNEEEYAPPERQTTEWRKFLIATIVLFFWPVFFLVGKV